MYKRSFFIYIFSVITFFLMGSCSVHVPSDCEKTEKTAEIYPDYSEVVIPYNIAPLNFIVKERGEDCIVKVSDEKGKSLTVSGGKDMKICFPLKKWKNLLSENKEKQLTYDIYVKENEKWIQYKSFKNKVVGDAIDTYLTYRLIEPSYMSTGEIGIYQFNLENSEEQQVLTTHRKHKDPNNRQQACVNCHVSQKNNPQNSMFYYRGEGGGLILTYKGKTYKVNTKAGDMYASTAYPSWHPSLPVIAFSTTQVRQAFVSKGLQKIEPFDFYSDLVLYDIEKNEISHIFKTKEQHETNPNWSPDGKYLYFCSSDSTMQRSSEYAKMRYEIKRIAFHMEDKTWGKVENVYGLPDKSVTSPKLSPDGNYMLFTVSDYGVWLQTNKTADLYLMNLSTHITDTLKAVNSKESDGYHAWSSSGRWFVFTSRRQDGNYARPYFSYFDKAGVAYKPFVIPHSEPTHDADLLKNYNVTEFLSAPVCQSESFFENLIINDTILNAKYSSEIKNIPDSYSGATKKLSK